MRYLKYVGKSNDKFTHNNVYKYNEVTSILVVNTNKNQSVIFDKRFSDYFCDNFTFIDEQEYAKVQRKIKLKKILNITKN